MKELSKLTSFFKDYKVVLLVPVLFFIISLSTNGDYGISWDEPIHFHRGQAYLNYFLTGGETVFSEDRQISYYQSNDLAAEWFLRGNDGGHPPLNDILAASTNYVFYQKLGILGDIEAHHLFNIIASSLLVLIVAIFAHQTYGVFASVIAALAMATYPLFFAESHFNIKDPPETAFFAGAIWAFWNSLEKGSAKWLILSSLFFGVGFGTKFNILFLPFILVPYLFVRYRKKLSVKHIKRIPKSYFIALALFPIIGFGLLFIFWPFLWTDPVAHFLKVKNYYQGIGTGVDGVMRPYMVGGINLYPLLWIVITTPPYVLGLFFAGVFFAWKRRGEEKKTSLLWLVWFAVPVIRVMWPGTIIYGGVRQIMEYIPAMALLAGLGAHELARKFNIKYAKLVLFIFFIPHFFVLAKLHPNQNVYFNSLIGGLSGAREKNIPSWGNSFGNAYLPAVRWINKNAEPGSKLALVQGTGSNVPAFLVRGDIHFSNDNWSGIKRQGEYLLELTHNQPGNPYPYAWNYINNFLEPVYEVKIDGVSIAKVWKNDIKHTKEEFRLKEVATNNFQVVQEEGSIVIDLKKAKILSRFLVDFNRDDFCDNVDGRADLSVDGENWERQPESVATGQIPGEGLSQNKEATIVYFFPGSEAKFIRFTPNEDSSCILENFEVTVVLLESYPDE